MFLEDHVSRFDYSIAPGTEQESAGLSAGNDYLFRAVTVPCSEAGSR